MKEIVKSKDIEYLMHFTRAENLKNIFKYGLYPRSELEQVSFEHIFNDNYRYDRCEGAICTSIQFPNYKMFYSLRMNAPNTEWAVIGISAEVLYKFECAFCRDNAGSEAMYNTPLSQQKGKAAFLELFKDIPGKPSREALGIPDCYPTNPQAEVLVFDIIPVDYIDYVFFDSTATLNKYEGYIPNEVSAVVCEDLFYGRQDYRHWKKTEE